MIIIPAKQGSPEWLAARAGVLTASEFVTAREVLKRKGDHGNIGDPTEKALDYAFRKAIERISKVPLDEGFQTWQMKRGNLLEPEARSHHEAVLARTQTDIALMTVQECGIMLTDDGVFGASVDGLIGQHGGSEYKCLVSAGKLRRVVLFQDIDDYMDQIQGCMWISGRQWWHFGLYCPALKPIGLEFQMIEVQRDDDYIEKLEMDLIKFKRLVDIYEEDLRALGADAMAEAVEAVRASLAIPVAGEPLEF